jgi:hypothetical protein
LTTPDGPSYVLRMSSRDHFVVIVAPPSSLKWGKKGFPRMFGALAKKIFGSANDRRVKGYQPRVKAINALEPELEKLSDDELRARTEAFKAELASAISTCR